MDLGITQFDRKAIVEGMKHNPNFYDKLFDGKTAEWFRDWYVLLSEIQGVGLYKEVFKKVRMLLGRDGKLYYATDNIYLENTQYKPENLKSPNFSQKHRFRRQNKGPERHCCIIKKGRG